MRAALTLTLALSLAACSTPEIDNKPAAEVKDSAPAAMKAAPAKTAPATTTRLELDAAQSKIGFLGAKVTGSHEGSWQAFTGQATLSDGVLSALTVEVDMDSTTVEPPKLQAHLKSADFFDVATFPKSRFVSKTITAGDDGWTVAGDLMLHGISKEISFPASVSDDDDAVRATAAFKIKRQDWGITYPGKQDDLIKDDVALELSLVFPKG